MNMCVYMYIFMKTSVPKDDLQLALQHQFLHWRLAYFGKELFIYICIYIFIYIYSGIE